MHNAIQAHRSLHIFQNCDQDYASFIGHRVPSHQLKLDQCLAQHIAIVGINQQIAASLEKIRRQATSITVFQIQPQFILPVNEQKLDKSVYSPVLLKNKRMIDSHMKSILALRFLDHQIQDDWLKHQLTPNTAFGKKKFLKSDDYYYALQQENCHLITWPIKKIIAQGIECIDGSIYPVDLIITAN